MNNTLQVGGRYGGHALPLSTLVGKTILRITGMEKDSGEADIEFTDGSALRMYHDQDCCEQVWITDVEGDPADHDGATILLFEESTSDRGDPSPGKYSESWTWTFYRISTTKGWLTIRWLGESNGYYGEEVTLQYKEKEEGDEQARLD